MNTKHLQYLQAMEIPVWKSKQTQPPCSTEPLSPDIEQAWGQLNTQVHDCVRCGLNKTRKKSVFGSGNKTAQLLIIGEAPGANEDEQGLPFVGRAGQLLTEMLKAIGIAREDIYITNILKCRPPQNRDPLPNEVDCCTPYLKDQIALIKPKLILAIGRIAVGFLLETKTSLSRLRGKMYEYGEPAVPLLITYHPAYLLRSPREKSKAYEDLLLVKKTLAEILN
jgi:DNA polymerase